MSNVGGDFEKLIHFITKDGVDEHDLESLMHKLYQASIECPQCLRSVSYPRQSFGILDRLAVPITRENGGWGSGIWRTPGFGFGGNNHGWSTCGAGKWLESNGYKQLFFTQVPTCKSPGVDLVLFIVSLILLCLTLVKGMQRRFWRFYGPAAVAAIVMCLSSLIRFSERRDSIDLSSIVLFASQQLYLWTICTTLYDVCMILKYSFSERVSHRFKVCLGVAYTAISIEFGFDSMALFATLLNDAVIASSWFFCFISFAIAEKVKPHKKEVFVPTKELDPADHESDSDKKRLPTDENDLEAFIGACVIGCMFFAFLTSIFLRADECRSTHSLALTFSNFSLSLVCILFTPPASFMKGAAEIKMRSYPR